MNTRTHLIAAVGLTALVLIGCKKESTEQPTPGLEVEAKNSVLIAKHTWTGCGPCGGWGYTNFDNLINNNPDEVHVAFKRGNIGGYKNQQIYDFIKDTFNIEGGTPTFHNNLGTFSVTGAFAGNVKRIVVIGLNGFG